MTESEGTSKNVIAALLLSIFDNEGPTPKICYPEDLDYSHQLLIAMKSISLLMGEQVYQEGLRFDTIKYFGILPFPDLQTHRINLFLFNCG